MFTTKDVITTITQENELIKHLASKVVDENQLSYRPNNKQRSLHELLAYMTRMSTVMITMIRNKGYDPETSKKSREDSENLNLLTDFDNAMDGQLMLVEEYLLTLTEEKLEEVFDLFGTGTAMPLRHYVMMMFRQYPSYRMQLFGYLKSGLEMTELNTMNVWMGVDAPIQE
jgi:hypothetical protein